MKSNRGVKVLLRITIFLVFIGLITYKASFSLEDFKEELSTRGYQYAVDTSAKRDVLSVAPTIININDENIRVHEYKIRPLLWWDCSKISKDGFEIGRTSVHWVAEPHFYQKGNLIVQYIGEDRKTIAMLGEILSESLTLIGVVAAHIYYINAKNPIPLLIAFFSLCGMGL
ncbi:hypothetical protein GOM49_15070 [Clostridium bovifaecis]|uniref:Uncharacterized protein n=1 Tax=Clostridium bovifaecis TaxID=2184719 RepID=A0A6I6ERF5_9CLOT|nr:hypothetical protein GOM49_15070 [Clostridium bovifaecis]